MNAELLLQSLARAGRDLWRPALLFVHLCLAALRELRKKEGVMR